MFGGVGWIPSLHPSRRYRRHCVFDMDLSTCKHINRAVPTESEHHQDEQSDLSERIQRMAKFEMLDVVFQPA